MLNTKRNIKKALTTCLLAITPLLSMHAGATVYTATSPSLLDVTAQPFGAAEAGGIVIDLVGLNGSRIVSQIGEDDINSRGSFSDNLVDIASQSGFNASLLNTLDGGLSSAHFRFTITGGDTGIDDTHFQKIVMRANGIDIGNWSDVTPEDTTEDGTLDAGGLSTGGFRSDSENDDTGWFSLTSNSALQDLYNSISNNGSVTLSFYDLDPGHFLKFNQFSTETIQPLSIAAAVPEPETYGMLLVGLGLISFVRSKKKL